MLPRRTKPLPSTMGHSRHGNHPEGSTMSNYNAKVHTNQGGDKLEVESGGEIELKSGSTLDVDGTLEASGAVTLSGLPTSDPSIAGRLWNDSGTVKISAGA